MTYFAYTLSEGVREALRTQFPPKFPDFIGHHVTAWFGDNPPAELVVGDIGVVTVLGHAVDESLEALVVSVNGESERADGKVFHVTWSLDREAGRKPVDSNAVIAAGKVHLVDVPITFEAPLQQHK